MLRRPPRRPLAMLAFGGAVSAAMTGLVALASPASAANCAAVSCTSSYRGGGLQTSPTTHLVRWQLQNSVTDPVQWDAAQRFLTDVDGSGYLAPLTQYTVAKAGQRVTGAATYGGSVVLPPNNTATTLSDADVQTELKRAVDQEDLPPASWRDDFFILFPPGYTITNPAGAATVCGYHNQTFDTDGTTPIRYAVIPDLSSGTARAQCFGGSSSNPYADMTSGAVSNQLVQMITDPWATWGGVTAQNGWYSDAAGEIGDTCSNAPRGSVGGLLVHPYWSNTNRACIFGTSRVSFTDPPPVWTTSSTVTAVFTGTDVYGAAPSYTCALDAGTARGCSADSTLSYGGLRTGTHTIAVTGKDGTHSLGTTKVRFIVDQTTPTAALAALPQFTGASSVTLQLGGTDTGTGIASWDVRERAATYPSGFTGYTTLATAQSSRTFTYGGMTPGVEYCFGVRARDGAGHVSRWTGDRCVGRLLDDRALHRSSGWSAGAGSGYYAGTFLRTTRKGATLSLPVSVVGPRLGFLATTCAKCGTVNVYAGSKLLKTVNLTSKTTVKSRLIVLTFSRARGPLKIVAASTGAVVIDGAGLRRT